MSVDQLRLHKIPSLLVSPDLRRSSPHSLLLGLGVVIRRGSEISKERRMKDMSREDLVRKVFSGHIEIQGRNHLQSSSESE